MIEIIVLLVVETLAKNHFVDRRQKDDELLALVGHQNADDIHNVIHDMAIRFLQSLQEQ